MMDATALFPQGFHPVRTAQLPNDIRTAVPNLSRASTPVTYYFIDFGISTWFKKDHEGPQLVIGAEGQDKSVPELSKTKMYDPFKVDIYIIGNLIKTEFIAVS